jgi:hypothetical protein
VAVSGRAPKFRQQPKRVLTILLPEAIEARIREESNGLRRRSLSELTTEALCLGFGLDPGTFGIVPGLPPPGPRPRPARGKIAV